ncbi:MAG: AraC family transcriptional regulator [Bacteroidia bacterium 44-10]|nr:MAG: AraC family transcriptional regulator [Bacteroidia bacterium 44-10]
MVKHLINILPGRIVYSLISEKERETTDQFLSQNVLGLQISGQLTVETSSESFSTKSGDMMLIRKHQLAKFTKSPSNNEDYRFLFIVLSNDILRKYAYEQEIEVKQRYNGKQNIFLPGNEYLIGFFKSLLPYMDNSQIEMSNKLGILKVEEAIELLLLSMPELKSFLFDFSEPHKVDLEEFMLRNFHFNVPVEKFAQLTGRSITGFKRDFQTIFGTSPRQWLQEKRLMEAHYQIENKGKKPASIYLDLGFESLSHFSSSFKRRYGIAPTKLLKK